jgi:hypothetical protein
VPVRGFPALARLAGLAVLGAAVLVCTASARLVLDGRRHMAEGDSAREAGQRDLAAARYEDAARAYVPGSPYPRRALQQLALMAKGAEMRGQTDLALYLWEVARRSVLATRHVWQPNGAILDRAERAIAKLRAGRATESSETTAAARTAPPRPKDPSPFGSILVFAGLLAWIFGAVWLCAAPKTEAARRGRRAAWICTACGTALWIVMAWFAG